MKMRHAVAVVGTLGLLMGVASCASKQNDAGSGDATIVVVQGVDAESGDPADQSATPSFVIGGMQFDALVQRDDGLKIQPALAVSWENVNDLTWRFTLRKDVKFHDGSTMSADDVVFSFERLLDADKGFRNRPNVSVIDHVTKVDQNTVDIVTAKPYAPLLSRLLYAQIVPKAYVEKVGDKEFARKPIGSGPYKFVSWTRDDKYVVERFDDYWAGPAKNKRVEIKTIPEASARIAALKTGAADVIVNVPPDLVPQVENDAKVEMAPVASVRTMFVGMNTHTKPLDDVRVRKALNYAVNKDELIKAVMKGKAYPTGTLFGPQIYGYDPAIKNSAYAYDPAKAKALLAEAGYPNGLTLHLEGPRGRYSNDAQLTEAIAGQLAKVGIKTDIVIGDWGTFWPKTVDGKQEQLWFLGLGNTLLDPDYYYNLYLSSKGRGYFDTPETDKLIFAQQQEMNVEKRLKDVQELHRVMVEDQVPWIFLWDQADLYAKSKSLCGWKPRGDERINIAGAFRCGAE
jgi:peptide/nickel transport system substrate-binding protein